MSHVGCNQTKIMSFIQTCLSHTQCMTYTVCEKSPAHDRSYHLGGCDYLSCKQSSSAAASSCTPVFLLSMNLMRSTHPPLTLSNLSSLNLVSIFRCPRPPCNPAYVRRLDPSVLAFSLSTPYMSSLFYQL